MEATNDLYRKAAVAPDVGLCCTTTPIWQLPGLEIPGIMKEMNYGCGSTVHARDLVNNPKVLYVGVGGGMELLQFSYFNRNNGGTIGVDILNEMLDASAQNFKEAELLNPWFSSKFVDLRLGNALNLPIDDESIDVAAQNCVFNIFKKKDLKKALAESFRVLKPYGRLVMSDPICDQVMSDELRNDDKLRAMCLTGAIPMDDYIRLISEAGFGTVEIRAKRAYRVLDPQKYATDDLVYVESIEVCAIKDPMPDDGPCVFTGRTAIYFGDDDVFDDKKGHTLLQNQPLSVCDKTAAALEKLNRSDIFVSDSTYFYDGGGCC